MCFFVLEERGSCKNISRQQVSQGGNGRDEVLSNELDLRFKGQRCKESSCMCSNIGKNNFQ